MASTPFDELLNNEMKAAHRVPIALQKPSTVLLAQTAGGQPPALRSPVPPLSPQLRVTPLVGEWARTVSVTEASFYDIADTVGRDY